MRSHASRYTRFPPCRQSDPQRSKAQQNRTRAATTRAPHQNPLPPLLAIPPLRIILHPARDRLPPNPLRNRLRVPQAFPKVNLAQRLRPSNRNPRPNRPHHHRRSPNMASCRDLRLPGPHRAGAFLFSPRHKNPPATHPRAHHERTASPQRPHLLGRKTRPPRNRPWYLPSPRNPLHRRSRCRRHRTSRRRSQRCVSGPGHARRRHRLPREDGCVLAVCDGHANEPGPLAAAADCGLSGRFRAGGVSVWE